MSRRLLIELSHEIRHGTITYPGLPGPEIGAHLTREASRARYAEGTEFLIARLAMVANTGTYVDAPLHRFPDGADFVDLPLAAFADLPGRVVRAVGARAIDVGHVERHDVAGRAVLVHTGWDRHWETAAYGGSDAPFLTRDAAEWLVAHGAALVGIDSINVDSTADGTRPVHTALLRAGVPIVEHLCGLDRLPDDGFRFHGAPPRIAGMTSFPVRAYAVVEES